MKLKNSTYFLGTTIVCQRVASLAQQYEEEAREEFDLNDISATPERHITLLPPFRTDYITASRINITCAKSRLFSPHPLIETQFSINQLKVMSFCDLDHLCFPLCVVKEFSLSDMFVAYVKDLRKWVEKLGVDFCDQISDEYVPHISVCSGKNLKTNKRIQVMIDKSGLQSSIRFLSGHTTLYTKDRNGWADLTFGLNDDDVNKLFN